MSTSLLNNITAVDVSENSILIQKKVTFEMSFTVIYYRRLVQVVALIHLTTKIWLATQMQAEVFYRFTLGQKSLLKLGKLPRLKSEYSK